MDTLYPTYERGHSAKPEWTPYIQPANAGDSAKPEWTPYIQPANAGDRVKPGVERNARNPRNVAEEMAPSLRSRRQFIIIDPSSRYRSEEHTSELQSLRHLVCRLLL